MKRLAFFVIHAALIAASPMRAESSDSSYIDPAGISGSLLICGGGALPDSVMETFVKRAGGEKARLVVIPTASARADNADETAFKGPWQERGIGAVDVLHTRDRRTANDPKFLAPLKTATAVWFGGGQQSRLADAYQGTKFEEEIHALLKRGGIVGGTSAGAAIQSRVMIAGGKEQPHIQTGLDLLPGAIIDQHFSERNRQGRLRSAVAEHPRCVGLGIDEGTAMLVGTARGRLSRFDRGRTIRVMGKGKVTVMLAASETKPFKEYQVGERGLLDIVQLQRAARARCDNFPPRSAELPIVPEGALVMIGGGGLPSEIMRRIVTLAGGADAKIVSFTTGHSLERAKRDIILKYFRRAGANYITTLPARGPGAVNAPENLEVLRGADCIWFGGGRQWRFVDAYDGTSAVEICHDVLSGGGVICGSSAGASIQGEYLARADSITNRRMMAEGYERGFSFLPGTAIDQHFAQRNRFGDLRRLVETYPQYLGIGIDEATAIVVRGQIAEVMGRNRVHFFDAGKRDADGKVEYESVSSGFGYDLVERKVLGPAVAEKSVP